jgi:uncharacterized membrane protein
MESMYGSLFYTEYIMYLTYVVLLVLLDIPWLLTIGSSYAKTILAIQTGSAPEYRIWGAIPVYLGMAYLLTLAKSVQQAFFIGVATYAVYDFTVLALLKKYPLWIACADTLWGGVLFSMTYWVYTRYVKSE